MTKPFVWVPLVLLVASSAFAAQVKLDVSFRPDEHLVAGSMYISWDSPPQTASFALLANLGRERNPYAPGWVLDGTYVNGFDPAWTKIDRVVWLPEGGEAIVLGYELRPAPPVTQKYSLSDVILAVPLPEGGQGTLRIDFRTRFPNILAGEPGRLGDIYTWRFGWHPIPIPPPRGDNWPLVIPAHDYSLDLELPSGWVAVLPGEVSEDDDGSGKVYHAGFPVPVRSISLFIAPEEALEVTDLELSGTEVTACALAGDDDKVRALVTHIPDILADYGERFGPCPYRRLVLIEQPTELGVAMAADGVVYFPRWFFDRVNLTAEGMLSRYGQFILAHELAHQWWGVGVGVDLDAENWLSEGLAQYSAISWYEGRFGAEGGNVFEFARNGLGESWAGSAVGFVNLREHLTELPYLQAVFEGFDEAVVKPAREVEYAQQTNERLYDKGYLVFRALAHLVGEAAFDDALREVAGRYRGSVITVEELKAVLEERSGEDLTQFFRDWVWGESRADYAVERATTEREGRHYLTRVQLSREGNGFLPVEVEVRGKDEGERARKIWQPDGEDSVTISFQTDFPVRQVVVDPGHYVLDSNRLNNVWPRKFVVATTHGELPLDGYLVRADPGTRAVEVRYLDRFGWAVYPEEMAVAGFVRYGRDLTLRGFARVRGTLLGYLALEKHLWARPETGGVGTWWLPAGDLVLSVSRRPYPVLGLDADWVNVFPAVAWGRVSLAAVPPAAGRVYLGVTYELDLMPNTYLDLSLGVGFASPGIPPALSFSLPEFHAGANGTMGTRKLILSAGLWLPPWREPYSLGGLALVSQVTPRAYAAWGRLWGETGVTTKLEVGAEFHFGVEMLGGLAGFDVVIGGAWPFPEGKSVFYFGIYVKR